MLLDVSAATEETITPSTLQEYVKKVVLRRNRLSGRLYKDDDTIMAWGLLNEPRCETYKVNTRPCEIARCTSNIFSASSACDAQ